MSTIYNPLTNNSLLTEFSGAEGAGPAGNGIQPESAPSSLTVAQGGSLGSTFSDALSGGGIPGLSAPSVSNVLNAFGIGSGSSSIGISRIVAIVLGLLLIGGGIIMFRPETVEDVRSAAVAAAA